MSFQSLYDSIKLTHFSEFQDIYYSIKNLASDIRKDYRRKNREWGTSIIHGFLKDLISPLSSLYHHRFNQEKGMILLSKAVRILNLIALELERWDAPRLIDKIRNLAQRLVNFIPDDEGIQLDLFNVKDYQPGGLYVLSTDINKPFMFDCFRKWLDNFDFYGFRIRLEERRSKLPIITFHQFSIKGLFVSF